MKLKFLYTAILILCMSGIATPKEVCAGHNCLKTAPVEAPAKGIPAAKTLITEKEDGGEFSTVLLTLYV
jgi:hypothetical protein